MVTVTVRGNDPTFAIVGLRGTESKATRDELPTTTIVDQGFWSSSGVRFF